MENTNQKQKNDVQILVSQITQLKTTKQVFRIPFESELQAEDVLTKSLNAILINREQTLQLNDNIHNVTKWLYNPKKKPWLLLCGNVGNGKTTLMDAVINLYNLSNFSRGAEKIEFKKISAYDMNLFSEEEFKFAMKTPMLAIDDLGLENKTMMKFGNELSVSTYIMEQRYQRRLMTIFTSNLTPKQIGERYGERIRDRFRELAYPIVFENKSFRSEE